MEYLKKIIFPYIKSKRQALKLTENVFKRQTPSVVNDSLKKNDIIEIHVPNNPTNLLQPLDISVNKSAKCFIADKYQDQYAEKVFQQLNRSVAAHDVKVDAKLSIMKPLHAKWIIEMYHHLKPISQLRYVKTHSLKTFLINLEYSGYITLWSISFISLRKKNNDTCVHFIILYC